eukprot:TRINITY_DN1882_c0_g1_i3.p1 TRINITY_DN1882_c0_g1~~TRINITY_DN1882_c0_g1_i3.p1  ORF type:complete len:192 (-),score=0.22 TRINITY_DN1882_c0_g1_i3:195-770(-)
MFCDTCHVVVDDWFRELPKDVKAQKIAGLYGVFSLTSASPTLQRTSSLRFTSLWNLCQKQVLRHQVQHRKPAICPFWRPPKCSGPFFPLFKFSIGACLAQGLHSTLTPSSTAFEAGHLSVLAPSEVFRTLLSTLRSSRLGPVWPRGFIARYRCHRAVASTQTTASYAVVNDPWAVYTTNTASKPVYECISY